MKGLLCSFMLLLSLNGSAQTKIQLSQEHINAVNRSRRIVLQYDAFFDLGSDFNKWINGLFNSVDKPGSQIDALWWDIGGANMAPYPSRVGDRYEHPGLRKWWDQGIDWIGELVKESRKRNLEVFWNHRIAEVDRDATGFPLGGGHNPLKKAHPEWLVKSWYYSGLWNLAVPEVRKYKVDFIRELLEKYEFDGVQLDFARHVPCLPVGRQWELRDEATEFVRMVRIMMLEMEQKLGRPMLLAARVPENLAGCRIDGFDVETWAKHDLVDIFVLGSRSIDVDVETYRKITSGHNIKLIPCWDDHHSSDGYRSPSIEVHRGIFSNWWHQGADGVMIFNWFVDGNKGYNQERLLTIGREAGSPETLHLKDKTFVTERRGGYPWAEGYFNRNDSAALPMCLANDGRPAVINMRISDNPGVYREKIGNVTLRAVISAAKQGDVIGARLNGVDLSSPSQDFNWKDNQIYAPGQQKNAGFSPDIPADPNQKLLRLEFPVQYGLCRSGENEAEIFLISRIPYGHGSSIYNIVLEKLELTVKYK